MEKKIDTVRRLTAEGKYKDAMRIAKGFTKTLNAHEKSQITRAFECYTNARFYIAIGKTPEDEIAKGIEIMRRVYI